MNNKFKKVNELLMNKTRESEDCVRLTKNTNCGHKGKYAIQNVVTNNYNEDKKFLILKYYI